MHCDDDDDDDDDVFLHGLESEAEVITLFCCELLWTGEYGSCFAYLSEI